MFAYVQKEFPRFEKEEYKEDQSTSILVSLLGPLSLLVVFLVTGFAKHGLKFK